MADTPGERLFEIRAECGGGSRAPMPMKQFVALVKKRTGVTYHANTISLLEQNTQVWRLTDVRVLAVVDPLERGEIWLSTLSATPVAAELFDPAKDRKLTAEELQRAIMKAEREERQPAKPAKVAKRGPGGA